MTFGKGYMDRELTEDEVREILAQALDSLKLDGKRVLIIIPDGTRTAPIPLMFRLFHELLFARVKAMDFLIALGTHMMMNEDAISRLVGVSSESRRLVYNDTRIFNHHWERSDTFAHLGTISRSETEQISSGMLSMDVPVTINRKVLEYDQLIVCGPVFPHEVMGFSGGTKYFFPGIAGPEIINFTHWLGALITNMNIIGTVQTPVRAMVDRAVSLIPTPKLYCNMVVTHHGLAGFYVGDYPDSWQEAVRLSAQKQICYVDKPYKRVLSVMPELYDDIWTASKGMYKMEPVIADGGEVIIYAPHIDEISYTHGHILDEVGYHVRDFFVKQWEHYRHKPWGVLAHSTLFKGAGTYDARTGIETPRIRVTLATRIPPERCIQVNLGYMNPAAINLDDWKGREDEGILMVPRAGELLYRLRKRED